MPQAVGGSLAVAEQLLEQFIAFPVRTIKYERFIPVNQSLCLFRYGDFFVLDFPILALTITSDQELTLAVGFFANLARVQTKEIEYVGELSDVIVFRVFNAL